MKGDSHHLRSSEGIKHGVQTHPFRFGLLRRAAQKRLQVLDIHLLTQLGVFDGLESVGTGLVALLLLGALLFYLFRVLAASLFFF